MIEIVGFDGCNPGWFTVHRQDTPTQCPCFHQNPNSDLKPTNALPKARSGIFLAPFSLGIATDGPCHLLRLLPTCSTQEHCWSEATSFFSRSPNPILRNRHSSGIINVDWCHLSIAIRWSKSPTQPIIDHPNAGVNQSQPVPSSPDKHNAYIQVPRPSRYNTPPCRRSFILNSIDLPPFQPRKAYEHPKKNSSPNRPNSLQGSIPP
ncbi:hypothetical protein BDN72DRAFT_505256 [Pluteus cervinus]|uniref:Uncharacterized protein n=1 Tax=Pluteus cervinus TaxID=181527 RepID=A0ACD3AZ93_9AGAR|nr:hypothetical protein BDN72DRAFT_505256 [Pluteus cervinus]